MKGLSRGFFGFMGNQEKEREKVEHCEVSYFIVPLTSDGSRIFNKK